MASNSYSESVFVDGAWTAGEDVIEVTDLAEGGIFARIDARHLTEEQFGPVAAVTRFESDQEAVELANAGDLALDAAVFTSDYDRALSLSERVDAGAVRINGAPSHGLGDFPFGGNKASGIGREGLHTTIEEFLRYKTDVL